MASTSRAGPSLAAIRGCSEALNEVRAQYSFYGYYPHPVYDTTVFGFADYPAQRLQQFVPTFVFPSVSYGWIAGLYVLQNAKEIRDDFSITTGKHVFKFGGGVRSMLSQDDVPPSNGAWTFPTDQAFDGSAASVAALKSPSLFTATGPNTSIRRDLPNIYNEVYVQDEWKPAPNLTFNLGLRYDLQTQVWNTGLDPTDKNIFPTYGTARDLSSFYDFKNRGDKNNFGPRLGFAWDVMSNGKTVLRGAYGRYYNPIWATVMRGEQTNFRQAAVSISNPT